MRSESWQQLLGLESVDVVRTWHQTLSDRELSARRATEIVAAAKQAREYFANAANSDVTVRPLLTFYGVASLARATLLLFRPGSGEESLARGHGLETIGWTETLSGDLSTALGSVGALKVRSTSGLFSDFIRETKNRICIHVQSSAVDWRLDYAVPATGVELQLSALMARVPDLSGELARPIGKACYAPVSEMTYSDQDGFKARVNSASWEPLEPQYANSSYQFVRMDRLTEILCSAENFEKCLPQFMHAYVKKTFGSIPTLHIVEPMHPSARYSQLAITYVLSYFLGMLTRYFPTHWITLQSGAKGDSFRPAIHTIQEYVELAFPELTIELIHDSLSQRRAGAEAAQGQ